MRALLFSLLLVAAPSLAGKPGGKKPAPKTPVPAVKAAPVPVPDEAWPADSASQDAAAGRFKAALERNDVDAAELAALDYLAGAPRQPALVEEMSRLVAAVRADRPPAAPSLVELRRASLESVRAAISNVEVHIADHDMIPGDIVPVFTFYETKTWTFRVEPFEDCRLRVTGKLRSDEVHVNDDGKEKLEPTLYDISLDWDFAHLDPKGLHVLSGAAQEARNIQLYFAGEQRVRAVNPEFYLVGFGERSRFADTSHLVFTDQSIARNVANGIIRTALLCRQRPAGAGSDEAPPPRMSAEAFMRGGSRRAGAPSVSVGDTYVYSNTVTAVGGTTRSTRTSTIVGVTEKSIERRDDTTDEKGSTSGSTVTMDRWFNVLRTKYGPGADDGITFDEVGQEYRFPLAAGMAWTARSSFHFLIAGEVRSIVSNTDVEVVGWETVTVPAGTFEALRIQGKGTISGAKTTFVRWYAPQLSAVVREESTYEAMPADRSSTVSELVRVGRGP